MILGYHLSSEEHGPNDLVEHARRAEEAGFAYGVVTDHFHPWIDAQGQSPYVWSVLGGIAVRPPGSGWEPRSPVPCFECTRAWSPRRPPRRPSCSRAAFSSEQARGSG